MAMVENSTFFSRGVLKKLLIFGNVLASAFLGRRRVAGYVASPPFPELGEDGNPAPKREGRRQRRDNSFEQDAMTSVW